MFNRYYQNELDKLRILAREFAAAHPAAAPMLTGESIDPDVERLLEGTAFLTGHLHHKMDDDFPEIIHGLMDIVYPHYLRPLPCVSIVSFSPKPFLLETVRVPTGTFLSSREKNGVKCMFQTCFDLDVHPLKLISAGTQSREKDCRITLSFQLTGLSLSQWTPETLSFFLSGPYTRTADLFACLTRFLSRAQIMIPDHSQTHILSKDEFRPLGFDKSRSLFAYPSQSFSGFGLLQEYFLFPQKFLFFELSGLENWRNRPETSRFDLVFELEETPFDVPEVSRDNFQLFSVPVINIFPFEAEPVVLDHTREKVRVRPSSRTGSGFRIYSVEKVRGFVQGSTRPIDYRPMDHFSLTTRDQPFYKVIRQLSPITHTYEVSLSLTGAGEAMETGTQTLTIDLTCTNGSEPEQLMPGDICEHTASSPELLTFADITAPTVHVDPPLEGDTLWRLLSHMGLNLMSLQDADSFRKTLQLYIPQNSRDKGMVAANLKRIQGIRDFKIMNHDRLIRGMVVRGWKILISLGHDAFASPGDVVVFGAVLDEFFSRYAGINHFTQLIINETISGETFSWPPRIGNQHLK